MASGSKHFADFLPEQSELVVEDGNFDEDSNRSLSSKQGTEKKIKKTSDEYRFSHKDILCLPDEVFILMGQFLSLRDLVHLSQVNKRIYKVFSTHNKTWKKFFPEYHLTRSAFFEKSVAESFEKRSEQEDDSFKGSLEIWSCVEKESLKIHRQTQLNVASGRFLHRTKLVAHSRYNESNCEMTIPFVKVGGVSGPNLELYDEKSASKMTLKWSPEDFLPQFSDPQFFSKYWGHDSQVVVQGNVVVFHFKSSDSQCFVLDYNYNTALLAAARIEPGEEYLTSLWHQFSDQRTSWWITVIQDKIYRFDSSEGNQASSSIEVLDLLTGNILLKIPLSVDLVLNVVCARTNASDHNWITAYCQGNRYRASDILIFDVQKSSVKVLEKIPSHPSYRNPLIIKNNKVYTILDDGSIPIWNAESGRLLSLTEGCEEQGEFRRVLVTNFNVVAFYDDMICVYVESEEGLEKIGTKSLQLHKLTPCSAWTHIEAVQIVQDVAVICFMDESEPPNIYLAFFHLNGSIGKASHFQKIATVKHDWVHWDHLCYATLQATPTSIRCHVFSTKSLFVYNFLKLGPCPTLTFQQKKGPKKVFPTRKEVRLSFSDTESSEEN